MKTKVLSVLLVTLCTLLASPLAGQAQAGSASWWAHDGWEKVGTWTLGGDVRVRPEMSDDMGNMGVPAPSVTGAKPAAFVPPNNNLGAWNDISIWRERARLWVQADLDKRVSAYVRLTQEIRWGEDQRGRNLGNEDRWAMLLDNAWLQALDPFDLPISFRIGRQDLLYGEGFLIIDSDSVYNPDGSRTVFFDAAKVTLEAKTVKTNIDLLYSKTHAGQGFKWESTPGDDEDLYGVYATCLYGEPIKNEFYLLVRNQRSSRNEYIYSVAGAEWVETPAGVAYAPGIVHPKREVYTWGTRLSGKWGDFNVATEFAAQTGLIERIQDFTITNTNTVKTATPVFPYKTRTLPTDILAFAGYAHASYSFSGVTTKPTIYIGYWFYSGDDRNSDTWGGFDDMYSQAPLNGEFLLYSNLDLLSSPTSDWDPFMHSNMHFPKIRLSLTPFENCLFEVSYMHLFAHQNTLPFEVTQSQGGKNRGDYIITKVGYEFSKNLSAHVLWENFIPGSYYPISADTGYYGRVEMIAKF